MGSSSIKRTRNGIDSVPPSSNEHGIKRLAYHPHPPGLREEACRLREQGLSQKEIAYRLAVPLGTISVWTRRAHFVKKYEMVLALFRVGTPRAEIVRLAKSTSKSVTVMLSRRGLLTKKTGASAPAESPAQEDAS